MTKRKTSTKKAKSKPKAAAARRSKAGSKAKAASRASKPKASKAAPKAKSTASKARKSTATKVAKPSKAKGVAKPKAATKSKPATVKLAKAKPAKAKTAKAKPARSKTAAKRTNGNRAKTGTARKPKSALERLDENQGPGPRMQQILQADIEPWKRDSFSDEEAQLREIKRIPVRNVFDNEEARKRLVGRTAAQSKRRFSRSRGSSTKSSTASSN